ncbi:MAG: peptidylprolyl isomerase [bacterium]
MNLIVRKRWFQVLLSIVLVAAFFITYRIVRTTTSRQVPPNIIADVDGKYIYATEFKAAINRRLIRIMNRYGVIRGSDRGDMKLSVFRELENDKILEKVAEANGVVVTEDDLAKRLESMKRRIYEKIGSRNQSYYNFFLNNLGFRTEGEFREYLRLEILELKLSQHLFPHFNVTNEEVVDSLPLLRMRQIYFQLDTSRTDSDADINEARKQIRQRAHKVYERLKNGEDFASLARRYSQETAAEDGGDIGWVVKRAVYPKFWSVASSLKVGEISAPFETQSGLHILKLEAKRNPDDPSLANYKQGVKAFVIIRKRQAKFVEWFFQKYRALEEEEKIKIYDPFLLGSKYELTGNFDEAIKYFRKASEKDPDDPYIIVKIGELLAKQGKRDEAIKEFRSATEISPMDPSLYFTLGQVYMGYGEHQKGLLELRRASDLSKLDYELHRRLESIYTQLGLFEDADRERERYLTALELRRGKSLIPDLPREAPGPKPEIKKEEFPEIAPLLEDKAAPGTDSMMRD